MWDPLHSRLTRNNMMMAGPFAIQLRLTTDTTSKTINLNLHCLESWLVEAPFCHNQSCATHWLLIVALAMKNLPRLL
jgi:hypothetical protein